MIAEPRQERKVSVVREAIEEAIAFRTALDRGCFGPSALLDKLHAAWLSLPKCLVCGAEDGHNGRALVLQYMFDWFIDRPAASWREPVCTACRRHPSIRVFEGF